MVRSGTILVVAVLVVGISMTAHAQQMSKAEEPEDTGFVSVAKEHFPTPTGVVELEVANGSFETLENGRAAGWQMSGFKAVEGKAPDGKVYLEVPAGSGASLTITGIGVQGNEPHLLSMWLRSTKPLSASITADDAPSRFGRSVQRQLPSTNGEWKRVGAYFRISDGATKASLQIRAAQDSERGPIALDDVRLRTATEPEFARLYEAWRAQYPKRDLSPRPTDGVNLALTIQKLEKGGDPPRPFLIWAIGSSYTNMLGMGETLFQIIRQRFPNAPDLVYKKHVGSSVPWQYLLGWARQVVLPEQPDLVLIYTIGDPQHLDRLIAEIRRHSTADIIVPSIHWRMRDEANWDKSEDAADQKVAEIREICKKYGVEFVESRREWAEYMKEHGLKIEINPEGMLKDAVHQSDRGALVINENIARHFAKPKKFAYDPLERERRLAVRDFKSIRKNEKIEFGKEWRSSGNGIQTSDKGARMKVHFQGNRIDLIGSRARDGGSAKVLIDGQPGDQAPVFFAGCIVPGEKNARPERGMTADQSPHGVVFGKDVVPQRWIITMISDKGDYKLEGSVTGPDGEGNNLKPFTSNSGQILIDPEQWRRAQTPKGGSTNKTGDTFTFDVWRCAVGQVDFKGEAGTKFRQTLAQNLENGEHELEIIANGDGSVIVEAFDVFEPPLR